MPPITFLPPGDGRGIREHQTTITRVFYNVKSRNNYKKLSVLQCKISVPSVPVTVLFRKSTAVLGTVLLSVEPDWLDLDNITTCSHISSGKVAP